MSKHARLMLGAAFVAALMVALVPSCADIDQSFRDYCARTEANAPAQLQVACAVDGDCCPGWSCVSGTCSKATSQKDAGGSQDGGTEDVDAGVDAGQDAGGGGMTDAGACIAPRQACSSGDTCCGDAMCNTDPMTTMRVCCVPLSGACLDAADCCGANDTCEQGKCVAPMMPPPGDAGMCAAPKQSCSATACCPGSLCDTVPANFECCVNYKGAWLDTTHCCKGTYADMVSLKCEQPIPTGGTYQAIGASCSIDAECGTLQCLSAQNGSRVCQPADACSGENLPCGDQNDCCGVLACVGGSCKPQPTQGNGPINAPCQTDADCAEGQCLSGACVSRDSANNLGMSCQDPTDCRGSARCNRNVSPPKCESPTYQQPLNRTCYPPGFSCEPSDFCCNGACNNGLCP